MVQSWKMGDFESLFAAKRDGSELKRQFTTDTYLLITDGCYII